MFGIVIMRKRTLHKLINKEIDRAVYNGFTLGYKLGQVRGHPIEDKYQTEIDEIVRRKGF